MADNAINPNCSTRNFCARRTCPPHIGWDSNRHREPRLRPQADMPNKLDIPRLPGNDLRMDQVKLFPILSQEEIRVRAWAEVREALELQLAPRGRRALEAVTVRPGESVLDIGCGGGETALDLARAVAPDGSVLGIDLSSEVLRFARRAGNGCRRLRFVQGDAQVFPFEPASFDVAFSRFGVMFFADPTASGHHSITSSAPARSVGVISRLSALAAFRLMTNWNLLGR
ncbi:class I SAM-dependent methyltransferase [Bradyrhizobium sp. LMG 9283]|uniref:class I SAM-dependent methyltransferase n=1 Tax=Bradyrhizobium sp. LMG 9283 TaxID=592064 RepID=UPI00388E5EFC